MDNMRKLIFNLMWFAQYKNVPIAAVFLDAEKAFDEVEWSFLFSTVTFQVRPLFLQRVKTLYKEPKAAAITTGVISPFFSLSRGTHLLSIVYNLCRNTGSQYQE